MGKLKQTSTNTTKHSITCSSSSSSDSDSSSTGSSSDSDSGSSSSGSSTQAAPARAVPKGKGEGEGKSKGKGKGKGKSRSSARVQRRDITVKELELGYDSCGEDNDWKGVVLTREERTCWLRALRQLHKDLHQKEIEDAKMARTDAARDKHLACAEAVRVRWQSVVQQVADKCLAPPLQSQWDWGGTPYCLQGWYSPETWPPPHLITYARLANDTLTKECQYAATMAKKRLRFGADRGYKQFWCNELWALIALGRGDKCICFHCYELHEVEDCPIINEELRRIEEIEGVGVN